MRINEHNIEWYLTTTYGDTPVLKRQKKLDGFPFLLQKDYGDLNDCTLTSITAIVSFLSLGKNSIQAIYDYVEKIANKNLYKGNRGTPYLTMRKIFHESLIRFGLPKANIKFVKDIGYNFSTITAELYKNNPLILTMTNDGRNYYKNHSVTIVGFSIYQVGNKEVKILHTADNWYPTTGFIDYNKINKISNLMYSNLTSHQKFLMWRQLKNLE